VLWFEEPAKCGQQSFLDGRGCPSTESQTRCVNDQSQGGVNLPEGVALEEVSRHKASHWSASCRGHALHLDRAIKGEVLAGRGTKTDAILLDDLLGTRRGFEPELFIKFMLSKVLDVQHDLLHVLIHHHTSNRGIRIYENAHTSITGRQIIDQ
jgi:hypothetical protein